MKAIVLREPGGPERLRLEDVPTPEPGPGEVTVALQAAALNRRDIAMRSQPRLADMMPFIPGSDGAGVVAAVGLPLRHPGPAAPAAQAQARGVAGAGGPRGTGVSGVKVGDEVVIFPSLHWGIFETHPGPDFEILGGPTDGTYAQFVRLPAENVFPKPVHLSFEQAAAFPLAGLTAWRALITKAQVKPGERVLIPGAGSGVATFAVQIARLAGARVYVTSHSEEKLARAEELGASGGADYTRADWVDEIRRLSGGGVEVVVDSVGAATFAQAVDLVLPGGRIVIFGTTSGSSTSVELHRLYRKQISLMGTTMGSPREFAELLAVVNSGPRTLHQADQGEVRGGAIRPVVDTTFPLGEASAAQRRLEQSEQFGKIVLNIA
jgi:zinc-binding alcohol dehydrogenase/oxidoreductase